MVFLVGVFGEGISPPEIFIKDATKETKRHKTYSSSDFS